MKAYMPEPPWGRPQSKREAQKIHPRWIEKLHQLPAYEHPDDLQCGGCRFYIPLEGPLGADWGACSNPASEHDRSVVFEHWTCQEYRY